MRIDCHVFIQYIYSICGMYIKNLPFFYKHKHTSVHIFFPSLKRKSQIIFDKIVTLGRIDAGNEMLT